MACCNARQEYIQAVMQGRSRGEVQGSEATREDQRRALLDQRRELLD
jgi:hypothetical protein